MYAKWKKLARATGDPARLTKIRNIEVEAKARIASLFVGVVFPTSAQIRAKKNFAAGYFSIPYRPVWQSGEVSVYGRNRCREMVNRPLSFVTSYNPTTDPDWPH